MNCEDARPVISQKTLAGVIVSCLVLAAWFIPDERELVHRLDHDGQTARLKQIAEEHLAEQAPAAPVPQTDREKMSAWLGSSDASLLEDPAIQADRKNMCAATETPLEVAAELLAHARHVEPGLFDSLADALVKRAIALGHPADGAALLTQWFAIHPSWAIASRQIQTWRWAVRSDEALKALDTALAAGLDPAGKPAGLDDLRVRLALESNQPNLAFDIVIKSYETASETEKPAILRRLVELASAGDRTTEASHLIAEHFKMMPFQTCELKQALAMISAGKAFPDKEAQLDYHQYASAMARWQEWAGRGDLAFDTWMRLAMLGDEEAWGRVVDLQDELLRGDDFALVLADRIAHGRHLDKEPALAAILLDEGRTDEAVSHLEAAAKRTADPLPIQKQLARIHQQLGDWEKSLAAFEKSLALDAGDVESRKGRAFALVRLRRYDEGCQAWLALSRQAADDAEAQETCAALCDSLGLQKEAAEATQRLLACAERQSMPDEHLELAANFHQLDDRAAEVAALRTAFAKFPASTSIRFTLAQALADDGAHDEAVSLLADSSMEKNPAAIELLIAEAAESAAVPENIGLFSGTPPACLDALPELQLKLAFLFDKWGRTKDSERIVTSLQKSSRYSETAVWHDLAKISLDAGDVSRAESFETMHLTSIGGKDSRAWELLGDIFAFQDRTSEAAGAYKKAIQVLLPSTSAPDRPQQQVTQARGF